MSIGKVGDLEGFLTMQRLKSELIEKFTYTDNDIELSIGTSADYEMAILEGGAT